MLGFLIQTLTRISIFILASVCTRLNYPCLAIAFAPARMQGDEQSNKFGLNKTIPERKLKNKNKIVIITATTVLLLVAGLYFGTFKTPNNTPLGITEYGVCLHLHQYDSTTTIQLLKQINATWIRIDWIPSEQMDSFVNAMKDNSISILAILDHNTMNATYGENFTRLQWQETVQEIMSTDVAKKVDAWEI